MKFLTMQLPHSAVTSSLLGPNILLRTLFSNTLSLRSSLNVRDQVSHPYKTTGRIMVLCILTFTFLDSRLEEKGSEPKHLLIYFSNMHVSACRPTSVTVFTSHCPVYKIFLVMGLQRFPLHQKTSLYSFSTGLTF
jgi:hypothetical protein